MKVVEVQRGKGPIILAQPHSGTFVPSTIYSQLNELGQQLLDTDWHVPELYDDLLSDTTTVRANFSRYVIDPNRDPSDTQLYPGQNSTGLVPLVSFDGKNIWKIQPSAEDIKQRLEIYHREYHQQLESEIRRIKSLHGVVVLYDCHSIRSRIPYLFDNRLPDLNIGDNSGTACSPQITAVVDASCRNATEYTHIVNGRFRGGWTTRHYGQPQQHVHAIQMELAQRTYLESETPPFNYHTHKAAALRAVLSNILSGIQNTLETNFPLEKNHEQTS